MATYHKPAHELEGLVAELEVLVERVRPDPSTADFATMLTFGSMEHYLLQLREELAEAREREANRAE